MLSRAAGLKCGGAIRRLVGGMLSLRYLLDIEVEMSIDNKYESGTWEESGLEIHIRKRSANRWELQPHNG